MYVHIKAMLQLRKSWCQAERAGRKKAGLSDEQTVRFWLSIVPKLPLRLC